MSPLNLHPLGGTWGEVWRGGLGYGKQVLTSPMARLRYSCHQTGAELQPENCQRGERSAGFLALAGVPAGTCTLGV